MRRDKFSGVKAADELRDSFFIYAMALFEVLLPWNPAQLSLMNPVIFYPSVDFAVAACDYLPVNVIRVLANVSYNLLQDLFVRTDQHIRRAFAMQNPNDLHHHHTH